MNKNNPTGKIIKEVRQMERLTKKERNVDGSGISKLDVTTVDNSLTMAGRSILTKLADYEDAEEQGLLMRLPCKVGDTVFFIVGKDISKQRIREMKISDNGLGIIFKAKRRIFNANCVGEDVFLTREEAEKKCNW